MMLEARCRNCGNTGISPWTGEPCGCRYGKALAQIVVDKQAGETTKECACEECDTVTWCSREPLYVGSYVVSHIWLCNACVVKRAQERKQSSANKPRAIIRHFAAAMERKLAANDGVKGGWRADSHRDLLRHLRSEVAELHQAVKEYYRGLPVDDLLMEAADVALLALMLADKYGALPLTDERGR